MLELDARFQDRDSLLLTPIATLGQVPAATGFLRSAAKRAALSFIFPKSTVLHLQSEIACAPPASPSCWDRSWRYQPPRIHVIPNRRRPVRNPLSCPPHNFKVYRHTSIYLSAGTPASTSLPFATPTRS